jgi:hypothetical protein
LLNGGFVTRHWGIGWRSLRLAVALGALACGHGNDHKPINIRDFSESRPLRDSLLKLVPLGTSLAPALDVMVRSGFKCDTAFHATITVVDGKLGSGPPDMYCWASNRLFTGFQKRVWTVVFLYDSTGVRDVIPHGDIEP